jgi:hypothetical protein
MRAWLTENVNPPNLLGIPFVDELGNEIPTRRFDTMVCQFCGGVHIGVCPRVSAVSYYPDGRVKRAEFLQEWDDTGIIFGHELVVTEAEQVVAEASGKAE